jgi:hypothetical protein
MSKRKLYECVPGFKGGRVSVLGDQRLQYVLRLRSRSIIVFGTTAESALMILVKLSSVVEMNCASVA